MSTSSKRRRDPLGENYRTDDIYAFVIDESRLLGGSKARGTSTCIQIESRSFISRENNLAARPTSSKSRNTLSDNIDNVVAADRTNLQGSPSIYQFRKNAVYYLFVLFGSPEKNDWDECDLVKQIMNRLDMTKKDVLNTLDSIIESADEDTVVYDSTRRIKAKCGVKVIIVDMDPSALVIYKAMSNGCSVTMATYMVNVHRDACGQEIVARSTVKDFIERSTMIKKSSRETRKSGSSDVDSNWAIARLVFSIQLKEMFRLGHQFIFFIFSLFYFLLLIFLIGRLPFNHPDVISSEFKPIYLKGYVSYDEKHLKQKVGTHTKIEHRVYQNAEGDFTLPEDGGVLPDNLKMLTLKFEQEARTLMGCYQDENGGKTVPVFDYTSRLVVGFARFKKECDDEITTRLLFGAVPTPSGLKSIWFGGYEARYGADYMKQVEINVNKTYCCVKELIDHIWKTANDAYAGTSMQDCFMIYHDHLSTMWEKGAIEYMKDLGMWDRLIKITGSNNAKVVKLYRDSIPGNSPEHARGTDSHAFSILMAMIYAMVALTCDYNDDDPRKFILSTPKHCFSAMQRVWSIIPPERFSADISDWPRVNEKIIEAKGCVVEGEDLRSGRRKIKMDGVTPKTARSGLRDTKATLTSGPIHPDAQDGFDAIIQFGSEKFAALMQQRDAVIEDLDSSSDESNDDADDEDDDECFITVL